MSEEETVPQTRRLDMEALKGLAHPLRLQILETLSIHGAFTASGLAERLGESSGATSYHLRQLERHGFVREVEGRGTGRERWWERVPGSIELDGRDMQDTPGGREASVLVLREWNQNRDRLLRAFTEHGDTLLAPEWNDAATISTSNVRMTLEQLRGLSEAFEAFMKDQIDRYRGQDVPGSRPVQVHFNAFPVLDGIETSEASETTR
jgi:DNA-binding transcriptional ArsR family regulator